MDVALPKCSRFSLGFALGVLAGCNTREFLSERAVEEKVERLRVCQTNRAEVEVLLGSADVVERNRPT